MIILVILCSTAAASVSLMMGLAWWQVLVIGSMTGVLVPVILSND